TGFGPPGDVGGTSYAWNYGAPQSLFINFLGGHDISRAYFATLGPNYSANAASIQVFGYSGSGNEVAHSDGFDLTHSLRSLDLPTTFTGIWSLELRANADGVAFAVDDLYVSPTDASVVPEPASFALWGIGAAGAAIVSVLRCRRRTA